MGNYKTKKEWEAAADEMFANGSTPQEINKTIGTYSGPEGTFTIQQAKKSKRGFTVVDKDLRGARNQKRQDMERSQSMGVGDTVEPPSTTSTELRNQLGAKKGTEIHHRISLIQNTPFLAGLSEDEIRQFVSWADEQGWDLGNRSGNPEILVTKSEHTAAHAWMRENKIEGARGPQKKLTERFKNMNLEQRKNAFRDYMYYVQGAVDEQLDAQFGSRSHSQRHIEAQRRNAEIVQLKYDQAATGRSLGDIPSGPRAGQRLPVNRRTVAEGIIRDLQKPDINIKGGSIKTTLGRFAVGGSTAIALNAIGEKAKAGDWEGAAWEGAAGVVGEAVPFLGDAVVTELENPAPAQNPTLDDAIEEQRNAQPHVPWEERLGNTISNEVEWAKNNPREAAKNVVEYGLTQSLEAGKSLLDNPALAPIATPLKIIGGAVHWFSRQRQ